MERITYVSSDGDDECERTRVNVFRRSVDTYAGAARYSSELQQLLPRADYHGSCGYACGETVRLHAKTMILYYKIEI